jgi:rod shape-determining protein MreC
VLLVISSLVLVTLDEQGSGVVASLRSAAQDIMSPVQNLADDATSPVTGFFDSLGRADELKAENDRLRSKIAGLQSQIAVGQAAQADLARLRDILDLPRIADYDGVVANVVDGSIGNFERTFQIDKGSDAGIAKNMAVVVGTKGGALVGKITLVSKSRATVERIDDSSFGVGVQILDPVGGLGPTGIAQGHRDSAFLELQLLGSGQKLAKGQYAITRGLGASPFPHGLVVGTVVRAVDPSTATVERAALEPIVDLDRLTLVKVLLYQPGRTP